MKKVKKSIVTVGVGIGLLLASSGCEPNLDELVFVPAIKAMTGEATKGVNNAVSQHLAERFGANPLPSAFADGLAAGINSLVNYIANRTINEHLP